MSYWNFLNRRNLMYRTIFFQLYFIIVTYKNIIAYTLSNDAITINITKNIFLIILKIK